MFVSFDQEGVQGVNDLKPHLQSTVFTSLERQKSQRQIQRLTGIDRKTIRRYQAIFESQKTAVARAVVESGVRGVGRRQEKAVAIEGECCRS
ncbi:MAG: hypothetical protein VB138_12105, partial [Burkholderia sp.]